jgi:hypothetical protein
MFGDDPRFVVRAEVFEEEGKLQIEAASTILKR